MKRVLHALLITGILIADLGFASPAGAAVVMRGETEVKGATVRLSDVFDGLPDGVDRDIARAPVPGKSITYDAAVLSHLAEQYKLDWHPADHADHFTVKTACRHISADDIAASITEKIKEQDIKGDIDVAFDNHGLELNLPANRPPNFVLNNFTYDSINRRFHADLVADGLEGPLTLPVGGRITVRHSVPVLTHRLEAGTTIGAADIDWISVPEDRTASVVTDAEQVIGHELRHDTEGGQPLRERDVIPPRLVIRGALVIMKIETPFMTVTAQGRALQDGKVGDVVRVTNTQSNRTVEGTVESASVVRILSAQRLAAAESVGKQE
jgi:flagella basal body P-ring formation protein FlgA